MLATSDNRVVKVKSEILQDIFVFLRATFDETELIVNQRKTLMLKQIKNSFTLEIDHYVIITKV